MSDSTMTPRRAREVLTATPSTSDRSMYVACNICGGQMVKRDAGRHAKFHEALAVLAVRVLGTDPS